MKHNRIVNLRYTLDGLRFDAAIDCDWTMHIYNNVKSNTTPIELYCFDHPEWDIHMMYYEEKNEQQKELHCDVREITLSTCVDMDKILEETQKWIKECKE